MGAKSVCKHSVRPLCFCPSIPSSLIKHTSLTSQTHSLSAMRTRFLTDFFNSSAASQSLQALDFLRFPPPELPSHDLFNFDNLSCFDQVKFLNISPEIERFSVNESLSKFFSDVLPHYINAEIDQQISTSVSSEEKIDGYLDGAAYTISTLLEFETPELQLSLKDSSVLHEEKMQIFFEVSDDKVNMDLRDFSLEVQQLVDIQKSIFHIEDYHLEFQEEHRSDFKENGSLNHAQISSNLRPFPLLEIDETSLGIQSIHSFISEDKHIIFESNESQQWMQKVEMAFDDNKHFLSMEFNILEYLLNHPPFLCHKFEVEVPFVNFPPDDIINAIDHSNSCSQLAFEPFQFLDIKTPYYPQVFSNSEFINEIQECEEMFGDTTSTTFNSLIVKHELILRDDSFKSLPVPIFSDHEMILSLQEIVEEILSKVKLQPSSTSDDIYLDWHLLEEDISSHKTCNSLKMFGDIETYHVDADMESCDSHILILEFVLFDGSSNEQKCKENREVLNIQISGNLIDSVCNDGIVSRKKMVSGEGLVDNKVKRDYEFVESMPQFNDVDLFLNSLEGNLVKKQKARDKKLEVDYALLPVVSAKSPIETHETRTKQQHSLEIEICSGGDFHPTSILNDISKNSKGLSHSTPLKEKNLMASLQATNEATSFHPQIPKLPSAMGSKNINTNTNTNSPSLLDGIIIMNTQNVDTEMIISRRSTYQRILSMEKQGVQVVERDLFLPLDLIITPSICLLFYDITNLKSKSSSSHPHISSCLENIAANVLTSLSFSFTSCILIFEGEIGFLGGIMESSDELYAASASLGIDLQIFYSYSSDTTAEIIVNSITHSIKSTKGLFPKMPESETFAESFLSKFPSINPLSAHAILSSGTLVDFLQMPHQQRVCAVKKYLVLEASIILFTALCKYGEREDSRSGMTDCCSSVSSGHDSGNCCPKVDHESKKRKHIPNMPLDYSFEFEKSNDVTWDTPKMDFEDMFLRSDPIGQNKFGGQMNKGLIEGYKGQVIDIDDDDDDVAGEGFLFGDNVYSPIETRSVPHNYGSGKRVSYDWCSFPTAAEITLNSDNGTNLEMSPQECSIVNSPINFSIDKKEKGGTPLKKAISSAEPQKGSPWTLDFLNKMKEKSRTRQQCLPLISSAPCFGNSSKIRKRKSPSILDFYRYKRNSNTQNIEHKGQNGPLKLSSSSKAVKSSPSLSQTWTPIDKRAKRKLTFATEGSKGQSKLIWSDKTTDQTFNRRL